MPSSVYMNLPSVDHLPDDILREIYAFLPAEKQITINRKSYDQHIKEVVYRMRKKKCYHRYIKHLIRSKKNNLFAHYLSIDGFRWFYKKNWREEGLRHSSYVHFLAYFAYRHESMKCYRLIHDMITNHDNTLKLNRNQIVFSNY
jgi:hypothetical protein